MNNNLNQNLNQKAIEWINIQNDMKLKFGKDIYDSWLKKIDFLSENEKNVFKTYSEIDQMDIIFLMLQLNLKIIIIILLI